MMEDRDAFGPVPLDNARVNIVREATLDFTKRFLLGDLLGSGNFLRCAQNAGKAMQQLLRDPKMPIPEQDALAARAQDQLVQLRELYWTWLRDRSANIWAKDSREACFVHRLWSERNASYTRFRRDVATLRPGVVGNILICLIRQTRLSLGASLVELQGPVPRRDDAPEDLALPPGPAAPWVD